MLPESLCRTLDEQGRERSSCEHCHSPCLDIDASKAYRTSLLEERGLGAAWWSYPGLVALVSLRWLLWGWSREVSS
jgi:hypothetical protein